MECVNHCPKLEKSFELHFIFYKGGAGQACSYIKAYSTTFIPSLISNFDHYLKYISDTLNNKYRYLSISDNLTGRVGLVVFAK